jgi:hypothetical protein
MSSLRPDKATNHDAALFMLRSSAAARAARVHYPALACLPACLPRDPFLTRRNFMSIMANASGLLKDENREMEVLLQLKHSRLLYGV